MRTPGERPGSKGDGVHFSDSHRFFVIVFIETVLLLTKSFEFSKVVTGNYIVYCFAGLIILFFFPFTFWFKNKNLNLKSFSLTKPVAPAYRDKKTD